MRRTHEIDPESGEEDSEPGPKLDGRLEPQTEPAA